MNEIVLGPEADALLSRTDTKGSRMLRRALREKIAILRTDSVYGDKIPVRLIPKRYQEMYAIRNLFRVKLPLFWRML